MCLSLKGNSKKIDIGIDSDVGHRSGVQISGHRRPGASLYIDKLVADSIVIAIKIMIENTLDAVDQDPIIESLIEFVLMDK